MIFCGAILIASIFYLRFRHLLKKKRELEYVVEERTWELKEALGEKNRLLSVIAHDDCQILLGAHPAFDFDASDV